MDTSELIDSLYGNIQSIIERDPPKNVEFQYFLPPIPFGPELASFMKLGSSPEEVDNEDEEGKVRFTVNDMQRAAVNFAAMVDYVPSLDGNVMDASDEESDENSVVVDLNALISSGRSVSKIYRTVLENCMVIDNGMTEEEKKRLEKLRSALYKEPKKADPESEDEDLLGSLEDENSNNGEGDDVNLDNLLGEEAVDAGDFVQSPDKLAEPTRIMKIYRALQNRYEQTKLSVLEKLENISPNDPNAGERTELLKQKLQSAKNRWETQGKKNQVEAVQARIAQLSRSGMPQYIDDLKERFESNKLTASVFVSEDQGASLLTESAYYTALRPNGILDAKSMMNVTVEKSKVSRKTFSNKSSSSGGGTGIIPSVPLFATASAEKVSSDFKQKFFNSNFKIEFEIVQGIIDRPWFDVAFLESPAYTMVHPTNKDESLDAMTGIMTLSDGKNPPEEGKMPLIPMTAYFVRNLTLKSDMDKSTFKREYDKFEAGGGISILGFGASGEHTNKTTSTEYESEGEFGQIKMDGTFLVGFASRFLGKAPNPDFESYPDKDDWI
ncbi:hypothetical protein [Fodinibius sp. Rm-B-1B1-1]|uniref:hypothetical protein n=1 Tax=Fodinibius alkaliphilus TaxID=3140241 RepID=UPI003159A21D